MTTYTDVQLVERLPDVLERACAEGEVRIRRSDGSEFLLRPALRSPLDVGYIRPRRRITTDEIVAIVREGRERG